MSELSPQDVFVSEFQASILNAIPWGRKGKLDAIDYLSAFLIQRALRLKTPEDIRNFWSAVHNLERKGLLRQDDKNLVLTDAGKSWKYGGVKEKNKAQMGDSKDQE